MPEDQAYSAKWLIQIRKLVRFAFEHGFAKFTDLNFNRDRFTTAGVLLAIKKSREMRFAMLTDGRDQIQLILPRELHETSSSTLPNLQRGARVCVTGIPFLSGRNEETAVPSLYVVDLHSSSLPAPIKFDEDGLRHEVTPRLVIGHLMRFVSEQLEESEYVRYEPQFITGSSVDHDTEPLMVRFPGRGADLFLEVSPLPQLLYAAVMTGEKKIYSPTRLFSRAYRDGFTSADSPIVAAVEVELGNGQKTALEQLVRSLIAGINKSQSTGRPFDPVPDREIIVRSNELAVPLQEDTIKISIRDLPTPLTTNYAYDIRRLVNVETPSGIILIEGHEGTISQTIPYHWVCVHVERLALGDLWRIRQRRGPESGNCP